MYQVISHLQQKGVCLQFYVQVSLPFILKQKYFQTPTIAVPVACGRCKDMNDSALNNEKIYKQDFVGQKSTPKDELDNFEIDIFVIEFEQRIEFPQF